MELDWRQQFESEGMIISGKSLKPESIYQLANQVNDLYIKSWVNILAKLIPSVTLILFALSYFTNRVSIKLRIFTLLIQLVAFFIGIRQRSSTFNIIYKFKNNMDIYFRMIKLLTEKSFNSEYLKNSKDNLMISKEDCAIKSIKKLFKICDRVSYRYNSFFIIIDVFLLWDYQCMIEFEKWKVNSGSNIKKWFEVIGEFEALNSISNIVYNNPTWTMPVISNESFKIKANNLGHPLLGEKKVCNNIIMDKYNSILLITGSNMSGKSTFLRTVGINLILCYIGAPVCASNFECSIMEVYTCMRVADNLEKGISSFYAEILRIKMIIESVKSNKKVFFLLDELFKATNSADRHIGAKALIKQLGNYGAAGIVSTHDLELCDLQQEYPKVKNYHFQEYYINNEVKFDYKIDKGVSTTRNALYLIKLAGIDLQ